MPRRYHDGMLTILLDLGLKPGKGTAPKPVSETVSEILSHPSGVTDPITNLLGSDTTTIIAVLFLFVAIIVASLANENSHRGPKIALVSIISICAALVTGIVACLVAHQKASMPVSRIVQIFSGAGTYGALIWGIALLSVRAMFPPGYKQVAKAEAPSVAPPAMVSGRAILAMRKREREKHLRDYM